MNSVQSLVDGAGDDTFPQKTGVADRSSGQSAPPTAVETCELSMLSAKEASRKDEDDDQLWEKKVQSSKTPKLEPDPGPRPIPGSYPNLHLGHQIQSSHEDDEGDDIGELLSTELVIEGCKAAQETAVRVVAYGEWH